MPDDIEVQATVIDYVQSLGVGQRFADLLEIA